MLAPPFPGAAIEAARDAAKFHLRIAGDAEDGLIEQLAATALALCEAFTSTALIARAWRGGIANDGRWRRLATAPVSLISGVATVAVDGTETALAADGFAIDIDAAGEGWVRGVQAGGTRLIADFTAGLAEDWDSLPAPLAEGVVMLVAHLFDARSAGEAPPAAVAALWRPWRRMRLASGARAA